MRQRLIFAVLGALLMLLLEALILLFLFTDKVLMYVFYAPFMLGTDVLVFARDQMGWAIPSGGLGELPHQWSRWLIHFNLFCYALLGFGIGWWLGKFFQPSAKPR
jgi:hypothetical protein